MNASTAAVTMAGIVSGIMILAQIWKWFAPSIFAASIRSSGRLM